MYVELLHYKLILENAIALFFLRAAKEIAI